MLFSCNTGNVIVFPNEDFVSAFFVSHLQRCNDTDLGNHVDKYYMTRMTELKTNEQTNKTTKNALERDIHEQQQQKANLDCP